MNKKNVIAIVFGLFSYGTSSTAISNAQIQSLALQSNGQVVAAGNGLIGSGQQLLINRYNTDRSFDASFGSNAHGFVSTPIGSRAEGMAVSIQADGKLVVAGFAVINDGTQCALVRYTTAGILDSSFGASSNGFVTQAIDGGCAAYASALQTDGKIIVAGAAVIDGISQLMVMRFTSAGILDTTFGSNGIVTTSIGIAAAAQSIKIQNDGTLVIGGFARISSAWQALLVRYTTDGTLDNRFGTNGVETTVIGSESVISDIAIDGNGNILAVGFSDTNMFIARYSSTGSLDTSFGTNGITLTAQGASAAANAVALQSNGSIVVVGSSDTNLIMARYTTGGVLDSTFATNGIAMMPSAQGTDVAIQSDDSILCAGFTNSDCVVAHYSSSGVLDVSWGTFGTVDSLAGTTSNVPIFITDVKSVGTNGGTFTAGAWQTRDLNTKFPATSVVSLSNNQIILQPGNYTVYVSAPAYKAGLHQIRLQDVTDGITLAYGTSAIANAMGAITFSVLESNISISKVTTCEIQHQCTVTQAFDGFGIAGGFGTEIYTTVKITKL